MQCCVLFRFLIDSFTARNVLHSGRFQMSETTVNYIILFAVPFDIEHSL